MLPVADSSKLELGPVVVFVADLKTVEHPVHFVLSTRNDREVQIISFKAYLETQLRDVLVRREDDTGITLRNFGVFEWKVEVVVANFQFALRFVSMSNLKSAGSI